jgi:hypothetical protein
VGRNRFDGAASGARLAAAEIPGVKRVEDHLTPDWFANDAG